MLVRFAQVADIGVDGALVFDFCTVDPDCIPYDCLAGKIAVVGERVMHQHLLVLIALVVCWLAAVGCGPARQTAAGFTPGATAALPQTAPSAATLVLLPSSTRIKGSARTDPTRTPFPALLLTPDAAGARTMVTQIDFRFNPSELRARAGQPIRLDVKNADVLDHQLVFDDSNVGVMVLPGTSQPLDFVITQPGVYTFACNLNADGDHRAAGMVGTLIVDPAP